MRKVQTNAELGAFHARGKGADAGNARTRLGDDRLVRGSPAPGRAELAVRGADGHGCPAPAVG